MKSTTSRFEKATKQMASGKRINRADDDAAGLSISKKMRAQIRGLSQAARNAQDGISLIQTAEGALQESHSILQRMRELAVQATSDINVTSDRQAIQNEISELTKELNQIATTTEFNNRTLLTGQSSGVAAASSTAAAADTAKIVSNLKKWWLNEAEDIVRNSFGISATGINMEVKVFDDPSSPSAAFVKANYRLAPGDTVGGIGITGKGSNLSLEINLAHARPIDTSVSGGDYYQYVDRVITHEITHAVMSSTMNFGDLPIWFIEGTAEFSHGADERLKNNMAHLGGGISSAQLDAGLRAVVAGIGNGSEAAWRGGIAPSYSSAYLATRYMDWQIKANGGSGIRDITTYLATNDTATLDQALLNASSGAFTSHTNWVTKFKADVTDVASMTAKTGVRLNTGIVGSKFETEEDTGSVLGFDATNGAGPKKTAESVVPETGGLGATEVDQPMAGFTITWPTSSSSSSSSGTPLTTTLARRSASSSGGRNAFSFQIGANQGQSMVVVINNMKSMDIGITSTNTSVMDALKASTAIEVFDEAILKVSSERSKLGAYQNRLEHTIKNLLNTEENLRASESRISDVDVAKLSLLQAKEKILNQITQSMLAQSNQLPESVLQLLR